MTSKELLTILEEAARHDSRFEEQTVRIAVDRSSPAVGPISTAGVRNASGGFDWESGMFLVHPDETLYAGLEKLEAAAKFANRVRDILYMMRLDATRQTNGNAIKMIKEALDKWLPDRSEKAADPAKPR